MASNRAEVEKTIEAELGKYPVNWTFGQGGSNAFVEIRTHHGDKRKVHFSYKAHGHALLNTRSEVRRALAQLRVEPFCKRDRHDGSLGNALADAARAKEDNQQEDTMERQTLSLNGNAKNGHHASAESQIDAETKKISKLQNAEVVRISRLLIENAEIDDEKRIVTYHDDWSDERILEIIQATPGREHLRLDTVVDLRRSEFGLLKSEIRHRQNPRPPSSAWTTSRPGSLRLRALCSGRRATMLERFDRIARYALNIMCLGQFMWGFGAGIMTVLLSRSDTEGFIVVAGLCLVGGMFGIIGQACYRRANQVQIDEILATIASAKEKGLGHG